MTRTPMKSGRRAPNMMSIADRCTRPCIVIMTPVPSKRPSSPDEPDSGPKSLPWLRGGEVLLADDDGPIRKVLSRALARFGLAVVEVEDGEEAAAMVAATPDRFRLVILDLT